MSPPTSPNEDTPEKPPPPYEATPSGQEYTPAALPPFSSPNATLVAPRATRPVPDSNSGFGTYPVPFPVTSKDYNDEKAMLKKRDEENEYGLPPGTHFCTTSTRFESLATASTVPAAAISSMGPAPLYPLQPQAEAPSASNRRSFFRSSVSNLRETLSGPRSSRSRLTAAERNANQMEQFARRLEVQNRMVPSVAEAEKRIRQLRNDAMVASNKAGPRMSTGIFKASCSTDLLFLMDATGSMNSYIEAAKTQVKNIVSDINRTFFNEADVRVAVVAYRDHKDKKRIEFLDFTADVGEVFKFLDNLIATGGDDVAEDVLGGLDQALKAEWKHQTRCIMHIADAPAHGKDLHDMGRYSDHYYEPRSEPHGIWYDRLVKEMVVKKINYIFFRVHSTTDRMVYMFMRVYGESTTNCKLHVENKLHGEAKDWLSTQVIRNRSKMARANAREYMEKRMEDEGGLHFEEVQLGVSYSSLRHLVVKSVTESSSRTAVRLSTSLSAGGKRASYQKSKLNHKPAKLSNLTEDEEVDVFQEAREWQSELDSRDNNYSDNWAPGSDNMSTLARSVVVEEEEEEDEEDIAVMPTKTKPERTYDFDTGEPQWNKSGWLDQTMHVRAFSPDVVDIAPPVSTSTTGKAGSSVADGTATSTGQSILDRMMLSDDNIRISTNDLIIHRRTKPFAQGALRLASYARTQESTNPLVVKTFKADGKRLADLTEDMRMQALCKAFALEFNSLVANEEHSLDFIVVTCLQPIAAEAGSGSGGDGGDEDKTECMSLEPMLLNGRYVKYNNNCGSVNHDNGSDVSKAAQAFSHFTFERSKGELLVADLQGVGNVLTDPAIHTQDPARFVLTDTNLGVDGFKLFFSSHKCNSVCQKLGLLSVADMFIDDSFAFRTDWPAVTYHLANGNDKDKSSFGSSSKNSVGGGAASGAANMMVCCSNKLCSKIVRVSTAKKTAPSYYWCDKCWPQLSSSTVKRVCETPDAYHDFEVSKFFFESQGQLMPRTCPDHGGVPSLPVLFEPKHKGLAFFKRRMGRTTA
ncbi:hypothetical protein SBRCBS47491_006267 [Sporothrix bragantina]|uniref:Mhck ef2 kinase domain family protein n=1 Tax=Sporothrix bragantina TaxID=671064 RepID=A0ABP0C5H9_9PEZI